MWETRVRSLGQEDPLEKEMATHSSTLAWKIPWTEEPGRLQSWSRKESDTTERLRFLSFQPSLCSNSHIYTRLLENHSFDFVWTLDSKVIALVFNMLSRFVIAFLASSKHVSIPWLQSLSTVILEPKKIKSATVSTFSPSLCHEVIGMDAMIFVVWMLSFKPTFSLSSFTFIKKPFSSSLLYAIMVVSSVYLRLLFLLAILILACDSFSSAFLMMCSAYKLNKRGDDI